MNNASMLKDKVSYHANLLIILKFAVDSLQLYTISPNTRRTGPNMHFQTRNPFDALADAMNASSDGSDSAGSPRSSGGSLSLISGNDPRQAPITPSRVPAKSDNLQERTLLVRILLLLYLIDQRPNKNAGSERRSSTASPALNQCKQHAITVWFPT